MLLRDRIIKGPLCGMTAEGAVPWNRDERLGYTNPLKGLVPYSVNTVAEHIYQTLQPRKLMPEYKERRLNVKPPAKNVFIEHSLVRYGYTGMGLHFQVESLDRAYTLIAATAANATLALTKNTLASLEPEVQDKVADVLDIYHQGDLDKFQSAVNTLDSYSLNVLKSVFDMFDAQEPDYADKTMAKMTEMGATALVTASTYLAEAASVVGPVLVQNWFVDDAGFMVSTPSTFSVMMHGHDGAKTAYYYNCEAHVVVLYAALDYLNTGRAEARWATATEKKREGSDHRVLALKGL